MRSYNVAAIGRAGKSALRRQGVNANQRRSTSVRGASLAGKVTDAGQNSF
jgi:hypothetical protein